MRISEELCIACDQCVPYCPVGTIQEHDGVYTIDEDECVECGVCKRNAGCPSDAFVEPPEIYEWPRSIRKAFSDPTALHKVTKMLGRGTEEVKTNDVTGRVRRGQIGIALEFGRPGVGVRLGEIEKMTTALAPLPVHFENRNPLTRLMTDIETGRINDEVKDEKVLSAILEFRTSQEDLPQAVATIQRVAPDLNTVFSWSIICRIDPGGTIPVLPSLEELGLTVRPNAKINLGMGKPLKED